MRQDLLEVLNEEELVELIQQEILLWYLLSLPVRIQAILALLLHQKMVLRLQFFDLLVDLFKHLSGSEVDVKLLVEPHLNKIWEQLLGLLSSL